MSNGFPVSQWHSPFLTYVAISEVNPVSYTHLPRTKAATPKAFERYCGRDTFWVRFKMQGMMNVTWCVFFTIHDEGIVLVRHLAGAGENDEDL